MDDETIKKAENFGIIEGISELILTTKNENGDKISANAAPFGIIQKNSKLFLRLFKGSKTYENLKREEYLAANITHDSVLYAESTFYDLDEHRFEYQIRENKRDGKCETADLHAAEKIPVLKEADRIVLFKCLNQKEMEGILMIEVEPIEFIIQNSEKDGFIFNRGFNAVIEACIHLTRYELTKDRKTVDEIERLQEIVLKCGRQRDKEAFEIITKRLYEQIKE